MSATVSKLDFSGSTTMSEVSQSESSPVQLAVDCKEVNYMSLRLKTEEGETITFPDSFRFLVVKQEPQDWDQNQAKIAKKKIILEEGGQSCQTSEPADFSVNSSQHEHELRSCKPNVSSYPGPDKDGDNMDTVETFRSTETFSSDLGSTKEWSEETLSCTVSFQDCKIKEEPGDINTSEIPSQMVSQDSSVYREEGGQFIERSTSRKHMLTDTGHKAYECDICKKQFRDKTECCNHVTTHSEERTQKPNLSEIQSTHKSILGKHKKLTLTRERRHDCNLCKKRFSERYLLRRHMMTHTGEKPYQCKVCEKSFRHTGTLHSHMLTHTGERPHKCNLCEKRFTVVSALSRHMLTHRRGLSHNVSKQPHVSKKGGRSCKISEPVYWISNSSGHEQQEMTHSEERPYKCSQCEKRFTNKGMLSKHMVTHTGERPHECNLCEKRFKSNAGLRTHMFTHTGERPHECNVCGKRFIQKIGLRRHMLTHTGERPYECNLCNKRFKQRTMLHSHKSTHTEERSHECNLCEERTIHSSVLCRHVLTDTIKRKPHGCHLCEKRFQRKSSLNRHLLIHTGEKKYKCDICKKQTVDKSQLKNHMRTHTGERPHKCNLCEKRFTEKGNLQKHMLTHTGEKPYECEFCKKCFSKRCFLHRHLLTHTGEKPYECTVCQKRFRQTATLETHMLTHTGERAQKCNLCEKWFTVRSALHKHMLTHSGGHPHNVSKQCQVSKEGGRSCKRPVEFISNSSELKQQSGKPNIACVPEPNNDGDNMDTVETYKCTESVSSDLGTTKEWSEQTVSSGVSF